MTEAAINLAKVEAFLARLYADTDAQARFRADPKASSLAAGLSVAEAEAMAGIDRAGFELACRSYAAKRAAAPKRSPGRWRTMVRDMLARVAPL